MLSRVRGCSTAPGTAPKRRECCACPTLRSPLRQRRLSALPRAASLQTSEEKPCHALDILYAPFTHRDAPHAAVTPSPAAQTDPPSHPAPSHSRPPRQVHKAEDERGVGSGAKLCRARRGFRRRVPRRGRKSGRARICLLPAEVRRDGQRRYKEVKSARRNGRPTIRRMRLAWCTSCNRENGFSVSLTHLSLFDKVKRTTSLLLVT